MAGPTVVYATSTLRHNDSLRFALQADARDLPTGLYGYQVRLIAHYGASQSTREFTGTTAVVNRQASEFGPGWSLAGLDRLVAIPGGTTSAGVVIPAGQLLVLGTGGALFFERTGPTSFASRAGPLAFHSLIQDASGGFALISPTGDRQVFNSAGQLTQLVDLNGNTTALTYTTGLLTKLTDPFGRITTFVYTSSKLTSISDFAGKVSSLARETGTGRRLSVRPPDPDGDAGPQTSSRTRFQYDRGNLAQLTAADGGI
ncbi:MAG: hypothetical protein ACK5UC_25135, partial [Planctomycetaceae bacterium]